VNQALAIDEQTLVNDEFEESFIVAEFINADELFVALHYNPTLTHYHFIYDVKAKKIKG